MSNALLNATVAVTITAAGLVAALATTSKTNHTALGDLPAITVYADRNTITADGDIPDLIVLADRCDSATEGTEGVEISYSNATADLPDLTVSIPRGDAPSVAAAESARSES